MKGYLRSVRAVSGERDCSGRRVSFRCGRRFFWTVVGRCSDRVELIVGVVCRVALGGIYANWLAHAVGSEDL